MLILSTLFLVMTQCLSQNDSLKQLCYDELGCVNVGPPFISPHRPIPLPENPEKISTELHFFSRNASQQQNISFVPNMQFDGGDDFDPSLPSYFIIHGMFSRGNAHWVQNIKDAILAQKPANVFVVDWHKGCAHNVKFSQAVSNTMIVGRQLGIFLEYLLTLNEEKYDIAPEDRAKMVTFIGHSLGAHVAAYGAKYLQQEMEITIGEIIGLDTCQLMYENFDPSVRLSVTDADRVIAIHTSSRPPALGGMGYMAAIGHADFYMNGGVHQPGCLMPEPATLAKIKKIQDIKIENLWEIGACSHGRSHEYFLEAIVNPNCTFWGHAVSPQKISEALANIGSNGVWAPLVAVNKKCTELTCLPLGLNTYPRFEHGSYIVYTTATPPFCVPEKGVFAKMGPDGKKRSMYANMQERAGQITKMIMPTTSVIMEARRIRKENEREVQSNEREVQSNEVGENSFSGRRKTKTNKWRRS